MHVCPYNVSLIGCCFILVLGVFISLLKIQNRSLGTFLLSQICLVGLSKGFVMIAVLSGELSGWSGFQCC